MNGTTIERTSIRATPGGDVLGNIPANIAITFTPDIGGWLRLSSVDGVARLGYVNTRSVKVLDTVTPPPVTPPTGKRITNIIDVYSDGSINVKPQ